MSLPETFDLVIYREHCLTLERGCPEFQAAQQLFEGYDPCCIWKNRHRVHNMAFSKSSDQTLTRSKDVYEFASKEAHKMELQFEKLHLENVTFTEPLSHLKFFDALEREGLRLPLRLGMKKV